jgi:hypothetical protein
MHIDFITYKTEALIGGKQVAVLWMILDLPAGQRG